MGLGNRLAANRNERPRLRGLFICGNVFEGVWVLVPRRVWEGVVAAHCHSRLVRGGVFVLVAFGGFGAFLELGDVVVRPLEGLVVIDPSGAAVAGPCFGVKIEELRFTEGSGGPALATGHDGFGRGIG